MARTKISEFSATPGDNTDIDGIDIAEGCAPSGINNAIRELMSQLKDMQTGASGDTFTLTTVNSTTVDTTNLEATNLKAKDGTAAGSIADSTGVVTLGSSVLTTTDINGGTVDGTTIGASVPSTVVATQVDITAQGDLRLQDTTGGQYVALQAPGTVATSYTLTLPVDDGTAGQALITDGSGVLSWSSAASGDVYGPASATDNAVARYDGTTGKIIQNSAVTIGDDGATVIAANSSSDGLRITQIGTGNALLVEDSANPDSAPFVIDANGKVIIGSSAVSSDGNLQLNNTSSFGTLDFNRTNAGIVSSGDTLGINRWLGFDGTAYIRAAQIFAQVDGTPGTNDMPGRLVFSTTADGASTPTERMRIDNAGQVGIGATASAGTTLRIGKSMTGAVNALGVYDNQVIQSDVTASAIVFSSFPSTAASAFTLPALYHFSASQNSIGATSAVNNQYGFFAGATLTGATNNYGFYGNIASGTGRWNFYAAGTAANYFAGNVGIGREPTSIFQVSKGGTLPTLNGTETGIFQWNGVTGHTSTVAIVAGNAATSQLAFGDAEDIDIGYISYEHPNNAFAFATNTTERMRIASTGTISLGAAPGAESLRVTPVASAVNYYNITGGVTTGSPYIAAQGSDANIHSQYLSKGTFGHIFNTGSAGNFQFYVAHTASAVNYLQVTGGATGSAATLSAAGSDTNIDLALTPKGTGNVRFGTLTANADAPITGYILIKDSAGTTRKLAVIA